MVTLVGLSGSLRRGSYNSALLRAAAAMMPADCALRIESIRDFPLYDGDAERAHGVPEPVTRVKDAFAAADGLLLVTPEYNNSIPGVAKNAVDWLSRPPPRLARRDGDRCERRDRGRGHAGEPRQVRERFRLLRAAAARDETRVIVVRQRN